MNGPKQLFAILLIGIFLVHPLSASAQLLGAIGGIEGVGEEAAVTPILTMTGEANLAEGTGVVGVGYVYVRATRLFGEDIENASSEWGFSEDDTREIEASSRVLLLGYGVTSQLNLGLSVPFTETRTKETDPITAEFIETGQNGLGNVAVAGKYQFSLNRDLAARLTVQFPSGFEAGTDYLQLAADVAYSAKVDQTSIHLQGGYLWTDQDRQDRERLDAIVANFALAQGIGEGFVGVLELNYIYYFGDDDFEGLFYFDPPDQMGLDLTPGLKIRIKDNLTFASAVRIALINDISVGYDTSYLFLLGYSF
jgi:hypothetical protein